MSRDALQDVIGRLQAGDRLLVTRLRYIGDVVLTLPLLQSLRNAFPDMELHYLAETPAVDVLQHSPYVDRVWACRRGARETLRIATALRRQRFAAVIDLFSNPRSALIARTSAAPVRIGEDRRVRRALYTHPRTLPPGNDALQQHFDAGRLLGVSQEAPGAPRIFLSPEERARGRQRLRGGAQAQRTVLVHLAATQPEKEWPLETARDFVTQLLDDDHSVVLTTAPGRPEPAMALERIETRLRRLPVLPLRDLLGVVAAADRVVSVDGGIVHCSVALERPTLALFGPTDASIWFPYERFGPYRVLRAHESCDACARRSATHRCMADLSARDALRTFGTLTSDSTPQRGIAGR